MNQEFKIIEESIFTTSKVDHDNLLIRDVAVLGNTSKNNRIYTQEALQDAVNLFENSKAFLSHSTNQRNLNELIGYFKNLRIKEGENKVRGDFYLLDEGSLGKKILKIAEDNPSLAGFSIDAMGKLKQENGKTIVESIEKGNSIDLVLNPATVEGIFESESFGQTTESEVNMPYPNEHACRLREPSEFDGKTFRRVSREHKGKKYEIIMGKLKGQDVMTEESYRYPKNSWSVSEAKKHCSDHKGKRFEPAKNVKEDINLEEKNFMSEIKEGESKETRETREIREVKSIDLVSLREENQALSQEVQTLREELEKTKFGLFIENEMKKLPEPLRTKKFRESLEKIGCEDVISSIIEERKEIFEKQKKTLNFTVIREEEDKPLDEKDIKKALSI